jgi:hypothetical protein
MPSDVVYYFQRVLREPGPIVQATTEYLFLTKKPNKY